MNSSDPPKNSPEPRSDEPAVRETAPGAARAAADAWTIKRLLDWTSDYFTQKGTDAPRLAAEMLLAQAIGCQRIQLYTQFDQEPESAARDQFREWVRRHAAGEPVAYLVGYREFYSLKFKVTPDVLIPRPETEHLVTETLDLVQAHSFATPRRIADVGTGCGALAVTLAKHIDDAAIEALDISEPALDVARGNARSHQVQDRIEFLLSDLFAESSRHDFDLIVSNPPYVGQNEREIVEASVLQYEPEIALFAPGDDGLGVIRRLVDEAASRLQPQGWLLFELSPLISKRCEQLIQADSRYRFHKLVKDLARLDRVLIAQRAADQA